MCKGEGPVDAVIYFLDEGLEYKMEVEDPQGNIFDTFTSVANGDMHTFYIKPAQEMTTERYRVNFYLKDDLFKLMHTENIFVSCSN